MTLDHNRDTCGGAAFCAPCNARMVEVESLALRMALWEARGYESKAPKGDTDDEIIAKVERRWLYDKALRQKCRDRALRRLAGMG